jgi:ribonuclease Z
MEFGIRILGSSSALPTLKRNLPSQVLTFNKKPFLIDCGEGTQLQIRRQGISFNKIDHIFISHLHGDHFFGLFGMISTMNLLGRNKPLHIFSPSGLEEIIKGVFNKTRTDIQYNINYHTISTKEADDILETKWLKVTSLPLNHSKPVCGFLFQEKQQQPNVIKEYIEKYNLSISDIVNIKSGNDLLLSSGKIITNSELVKPKPKPRSYAYFTDTKFVAEQYFSIKGVDVLYHEATFAEEDKQLAHTTGHSTAMEAASAALETDAKLLIIGHFSSRYKTHNHILEEAKKVFKNTISAEDGNYIEITHY